MKKVPPTTMSSVLRFALFTLGISAVCVLVGCSVKPGARSAASTIHSEEIAVVAEQVIFSWGGSVVNIDCGDRRVAFKVGSEVSCTATEEGVNESVALSVAIDFIQGENFTVVIGNDGPPRPAGPSLP